MQAIVNFNGKRDCFDRTVGQAWFVIGLGVDPAVALNPTQLELLPVLDVRTATISTAGTASHIVDTFAGDDRYIKSTAVFGVKKSLLASFARVDDARPGRRSEFDFVLVPTFTA